MDKPVSLPLASPPTVRDPVCGMLVDPASAPASVDHAGQTYHFCNPGCARRFQADPLRYTTGVPKAEPMGASEEPADYTPLIVVTGLITLATAALAARDLADGSFDLATTLARFMAGFFLVFAGFKLLDLRAFADAYSTYDLLARRVPAYGYVYPFIELGFGIAMLLGLHTTGLLLAEAAVMAFSGVGVAVQVARRQPFRCACLGTVLKVPLTKVTLVEDFGMAALAIVLLVL